MTTIIIIALLVSNAASLALAIKSKRSKSEYVKSLETSYAILVENFNEQSATIEKLTTEANKDNAKSRKRGAKGRFVKKESEQ